VGCNKLSFNHKHLEIIYCKANLDYFTWILSPSLKTAGSVKGTIGRTIMWTFMNVEILILPFIGDGDGSQIRQQSMSWKKTLNFNIFLAIMAPLGSCVLYSDLWARNVAFFVKVI